MQLRLLPYILFFFTATTLYSCKSGSINLFKAATPHQQYQRKLESAGLDKTAMGTAWIKASIASKEKALDITIPYKETGYFAADKVDAAAYQFSATKGQKITITLKKKPAESAIYLDLWYNQDINNQRHVTSADTLNSLVEQDIDRTGSYLIRLQPELLQSVEYTLEITTGPSLAFPLSSKNSKHIQSYWGDSRDNNARRHEGVDIFGNFRTPVLAAANGTVTRVNENNLGGKVVWLRPNGKDYNLYYAHLDEQIATEGQVVKIGDTLGLMGNTGNARSTPTHLHFGIYTSGGAIDPLPFINPVTKTPANITAATTNLNKSLRTTGSTNLFRSPENKAVIISKLATGTMINIGAATGNYYRAALPDGSSGFIQSNKLTTKPLRKIKLSPQQLQVFNQPDSLAPVKTVLQNGQLVSVLGNFGNFQFITDDKDLTGWVIK